MTLRKTLARYPILVPIQPVRITRPGLQKSLCLALRREVPAVPVRALLRAPLEGVKGRIFGSRW